MSRRLHFFFLSTLLFIPAGWSLSALEYRSGWLVPMDEHQDNHLRAYGLTFFALKQGYTSQWLLNYRGGSFFLPDHDSLRDKALAMGVSLEKISAERLRDIHTSFAESNSEMVPLEKPPRIAVYTPPGSVPWDDAVTMALEYAEIQYDKVWDPRVLKGDLKKYDWLHLHHEDFTGQFGKFYGSAGTESWYLLRKKRYQQAAREAGFERVADHKGAVSREIQRFVAAGGFLFAMCSATDTLDISLAARGVDIVAPEIDGTPIDPEYRSKLHFENTLAFTGFRLITDPRVYEFSDIDIDPRRENLIREKDYFTLFEYSAHQDPVPTMLTQNHRRVIAGFLGQTTAFRRERIKKRVLVLGESEGTQRVRYIHGKFGKGNFTFLGGHDPEDYIHQVGDPPTDLNLKKNSPGYRLILNNILFPAARHKEQKT